MQGEGLLNFTKLFISNHIVAWNPYNLLLLHKTSVERHYKIENIKIESNGEL